MLGTRIEFFLFSILAIHVVIIPAFADENIENNNSIILSTDKPEYEIGDSLVISGVVEEKKMPVVALRLFDPDGMILSANQVEVNDDNTFSKSIFLDGTFYSNPGTYTVSLNYGKLKAETFFDMMYEVEENPNEFSIISIPETSSLEIFVATDKLEYQDEDTIIITGIVSTIQEPSVLIGIYDPFGAPTGFYFADVNPNAEFFVSFLVKSGVNFKTEGAYSATAHYGESKDTTTFNFVEKNEMIETENAFDEANYDDAETITDESISDDIIFLENPPQDNEKSNNDIQTSNLNDDEKVNDDNIVQNNDLDTEIFEANISQPTNNLSVEDIELGKLLNGINLHCDNSEFVDSISYYDGMGPALVRLCKYNDAISYYDTSLIEDPNNVEILNNKGSALAKLSYYDEAIIYYDSALSIDSKYVPALNNKGNALASLSKYDEAISTYNKALLLAPDHTIAIKNLEKTKEKLLASNGKNFELNSNAFEETENTINSDNTETPDILQQISSTLSSIGNAIFGFLS